MIVKELVRDAVGTTNPDALLRIMDRIEREAIPHKFDVAFKGKTYQVECVSGHGEFVVTGPNIPRLKGTTIGLIKFFKGL